MCKKGGDSFSEVPARVSDVLKFTGDAKLPLELEPQHKLPERGETMPSDWTSCRARGGGAAKSLRAQLQNPASDLLSLLDLSDAQHGENERCNNSRPCLFDL